MPVVATGLSDGPEDHDECGDVYRASAQKATGEREAKTATTPLRMVVAPGTPKRRCSLHLTPFTRVGVGAHRLITPPQAREPQ